MMTTQTTPRVWVGCLGCYSAGRLFGYWCDATQATDDPETWADLVLNLTGDNVIDDHEHEELWVFDHEGFHGTLTGECSPSEAKRVAEVLAAVEADGYPVEAFAAWVASDPSLMPEEWDRPTGETFADAYCGEYESGADYAQELAEELSFSQGEGVYASRWPFTYIDWQHAWREMELGDGYWTAPAPGGRVYVFRSL